MTAIAREHDVTTLTLPVGAHPGALVDVRSSGDVEPDNGRLLSVAELQSALRVARSSDLPARSERVRALRVPALRTHAALPATDGVVGILAAHGGAGASTMALAIATAAAEASRTVQLIEWCPPDRSGLVTASTSELGAIDGGCWRRGGRGNGIVIDRRGELEPADWPPAPNPSSLRLVDLGLSDMAEPFPVVLVCRSTVPGVRRAERALARLHGALALAAVGPVRWPGQVTSSAGAHVQRLREEGRVVAVPLDRRLDVEGLTGDPLPKQVIEAGRQLLALLDAALSGTPAELQAVRPTSKKGTPR